MKSTREFVNTNGVLDRLREAYKLESDAELARFLEVNPSTVATWRRKESMKFDRIFDHARDLNLHWLLTGEGPLLPIRATKSRQSTTGRSNESRHNVPFLEVSPTDAPGAAIGEPESEHVMDSPTLSLTLPEAFVRQELDSRPEDLFLCRAPEGSMKPLFHHRDVLLVNRAVQTPVTGRVFLIRLQQSLLCRRIQVLPNHQIQLLSDNPVNHPSMTVSANERSLKLLGMVVWAGRPV